MTQFNEHDYCDDLGAQEDWYNGIKFRSKLESKTAQTLDILGIPYEYEPDGYKLSNGLWYRPDFYLTKAHQFVECKGVMTNRDSAKVMGLVEDTDMPVIVIGYDKVMMFTRFFNEPEQDIVYYDHDIHIGLCCMCFEKFFYAGEDTYKCPACGAYDGDHHLCDVCDVESGTALFRTGQDMAASDPRYARIADAFNSQKQTIERL